MRRLATAERIREFLHRLGREVTEPTTAYLTGGATAVLVGWRDSTIDIDLRLEPDSDRALRAIPTLKEELEINVELVSPEDFIPVIAGWADRSPWVMTDGALTTRHFDLVAQALAKIERGHDRDVADVEAMIERGLVRRVDLALAFRQIEPLLYRYPSLDPGSFRRAVGQVTTSNDGEGASG